MTCCRSYTKFGIIAAAAVMILGLFNSNALAAALGHYVPGVLNIRDFFVPEEGFYYAQYLPYYNADKYMNSSGNKVTSVQAGPNAGVTVNVDASVHTVTFAPALLWSTHWKILGARYGAYISPTMSNTNLSASLNSERLGFQSNTTNYAWGDMYVQPIWLDWALEHWDIEVAEGVYVPVGKYDTSSVTIGPNTFNVPSSSNVGMGFWTNQLQAGAAWYPFDNKGTAVSGVLTWEANGKMKGIEITPGQRVTDNWGISQYLPITKDQSRLVEVGFTGYDQWQVTNDTGSEAENGNVHDQAHAIGLQAGLTIVPSSTAINFRFLHEYGSRDRFMGDWYSVSYAVKAF